MKSLGVVAADDHGEGVFKAERRAGGDLVAGFVETLNCGKDARGVSIKWLLEDGGEGSAGVFNVGVDAAGDQRLLADVAAGEVEAAFDLESRFGYDLLREQFTA